MRRTYGYGRRKKSRWGLWLGLIVLLLAGAAAAFVMLSPKFERVPPSISMNKSYIWSPGKTIRVTLRDNHALGGYQALLSNGSKQLLVASNRFALPLKETEVAIELPGDLGKKLAGGRWRLIVLATDRSLWNFGEGNRAQASATLLVDREPPEVALISYSPSIVRGGSAMVVFKAVDPHLKEVYLQVGSRRFEVLPYRHKGYWATLFAWPFQDKGLDARVVAVDRSGNRKEVPIPIDTIYKRYKVSWIALSDRFLQGKIAQIARRDPKAAKAKDPLARFKAVNEGMRQANEKLIHRYTSKPTKVDFDRWRPHPFYPLKGAKLVADFGDERHYYYKDRAKEVSRSYHLGYDLASVRHAPIRSSNDAMTVFAGYNGIYGKMPILDHGFGLYTLYGHCSTLKVEAGDPVKAGQTIARTGMTGLALGDHLHFGILIQGVEVLPMDWFKANWIKSHIVQVMERADRLIRRQTEQ